MASLPNGKLIVYPPQYSFETFTKPPSISTPGFVPRWDAHGYIQMSQSVRAGHGEFQNPPEIWPSYYAPQIIDWPFATDYAGRAFDQSNLYGIRFGGPPDGDPEDMDLIPVPKSLPSGYTNQPLRCRGATQALYPDPFPLYANAFIRTATATVPSPAKAKYRENTPEAYGRLSFGGTGMSGGAGPFGYKYQYAAYGLGYRSGEFGFTPFLNPDPYNYTIRLAISDYDEDDLEILDLYNPPDLIEIWSTSGTIPAFNTDVVSGTLPYYAVPPAGGRRHFWAVLECDGGSAGIALGYRTDIPFHYPIVYKNKCVRGGILTAAY